jgi:hypothetical protein
MYIMARAAMTAALLTGAVQAPFKGQQLSAQAKAAPVAYVIPDPLPDGPALPNDDQLDCPQILAESRGRLSQLSDLETERDAIVYKKGAKTKALEVAGTLLGGALPGPLGQGASMASAAAQFATTRADAKVNYGSIDRRLDWVMDRMDLMNSLYQARCL